ncbi:MAG: hypothetical protein ACK5U6_10470 [Pseudanabaena sp.]
MISSLSLLLYFNPHFFTDQCRFGVRCNLIAAIYNFEVSLPASKTSSPQS